MQYVKVFYIYVAAVIKHDLSIQSEKFLSISNISVLNTTLLQDYVTGLLSVANREWI